MFEWDDLVTLEDILAAKGKEYFFIMHLSYNGSRRKVLWDYAKKMNLIGLDHREVEQDWRTVPSSLREKVGKKWAGQFDMLCSEMIVGDIVLIIKGWDSLLGVAEVTKPKHQYRPELNGIFFDHVRDIKWIRKNEYSEREPFHPPLVFYNTLERVPKSSPRWNLLKNTAV